MTNFPENVSPHYVRRTKRSLAKWGMGHNSSVPPKRTSLDGPPRFKQNIRRNQYVYLGDNIKFKCDAVGRPAPKVHWYREDVYLDYKIVAAQPRYKDNGFLFEIKRIEVGDKVSHS